MSQQQKPLTAFAVLSAAAASMALPVADAQAEARPDERIISYRNSQYQEDDAPASRTFNGVTDRYSVSVHQLGFDTPIADDWYLTSELQYETMSGASPMQTYENSDGQSVLVMSGASIDDTRIDLKLAPTRYFEQGTVGGSVAISSENDYQSLAAGVNGSLALFNDMATLQGGVSLAHDTLSPTDPELSTARQQADGATKTTVSLFQGVSLVLSKDSALNLGLVATHSSGYLSDPYKTDDRRPDSRAMLALSSRYRHYLSWGPGQENGWHLDARWYQDDWSVRSQTLTTRLVSRWTGVHWRFELTPMLRYYRQSQAAFYGLEQTPDANNPHSSDARLSTYGALALGLSSELGWKAWSLSLDYQTYDASEGLALVGDTDKETPGLVDYQLFSLGVSYQY